MNAEQARRLAAVAGVLVVISIFAGGFAEIYVPGKLLVASDPNATAANVGFIVKNVIAVALPQYDSDLLLAPMFVTMIALAAWLLLKGVARQRWPATSNFP